MVGLVVRLDSEQLAWLASALSNTMLGGLRLSGFHVLGPDVFVDLPLSLTWCASLTWGVTLMWAVT